MITVLVPLAAAVGAPELPNARQVVADAQGCARADASGNVNVIAPPAGVAVNWITPCVIIPNGGTVTFQQADAIPHGAISSGCFSLGTMSAVGGTPASSSPAKTSIKLDFVAEEALAYTLSNGVEFGACSSFTGGEDKLTIPYQCVIHGAAMSGKIIVEL